MDINIAGPIDGIATAKLLKEITKAPLVYITSQTDEETIIRAADTRPASFQNHLRIRISGSQLRSRSGKSNPG